ncbi:MAG: glycosyltransferase family 2 protein [Dongiaceae bacterium]
MVIAVCNEAENVEAVTRELIDTLRGSAAYEIVYVDDGSTDDTAARLIALRRAGSPLRLIRHDRRCGKSRAMATGVWAARAAWIATMDGDGQDDPAEVATMLDLAWRSPAPPLVAGIRARRRDPWHRQVATRVGNGVRQWLLRDNCRDSACGLKVFRRDDYLRLPAFEGQHRFLPALFQLYGHPLICHEVRHRPRLRGRSKYTNLRRAMVGIADLRGVLWLRRRTRLPGRVVEE